MRTVVHLLRHGEVHNPTGVLYGRMAGYHLSPLGQQMAQRVADTIADRDITHLLWNPFRPSWGEPYKQLVARMMAAVHDARDAAVGHEAVIVSHQLPIWITRLHVEGRSFLHDPRRRQCTLCSLTSFTFEDEHLTTVRYSEPAADLIPVKDRKAPFSAGGAPAGSTPPSGGA
jgi:broad specificity phosphatase PhoE